MQSAVRYQGALEPFDVVVACDPSQDTARQEFKQECDVDYQLRRVGAGMAFLRPAQSGVQDFDVTMQEAIQSVRDARRAWDRLPDGIRSRYRTWEDVAIAMIDGSFKPLEGPAGGSGGPEGGSPSPEGAAASGGSS